MTGDDPRMRLDERVPLGQPADAITVMQETGPRPSGEPPALCRIHGVGDGGIDNLELVGKRFDGVLLAKA